MATKGNDFAVVVGISDYPDFPDLKRLVGPANDAKVFASWLSGEGGVAADRIRLLVSGDVPTPESRPTAEDVDSAFAALLSEFPGDDTIGRRLYIYLAGYGVAPNSDEIVLLTADTSPRLPARAIGAKAYADYFRAAGRFEEIVLFVDCAQAVLTHPVQFAPQLPPWRSILSALNPSFLYVFATTRTDREAVDSEVENGARGVFTSALLSGLRGRAAGLDGSITSETLASYVSSRIRERGEDLQAPVFLLDPSRPIVFRAAAHSEATLPGVEETTAPRSGVGFRPQSPPVSPTPRIASDRWARQDALGYGPFARTVATLITHPETLPPLTIGIKAPWGAGKTSLMKRIQYLLDGNAAVTEENESARRNRDLGVTLTLEQMLAGLRALRTIQATPQPLPPTMLQKIVKWLRQRVPVAMSASQQTATTSEGVVSDRADERREERFQLIWRVLQTAAAAVTEAAHHLPPVHFTPPQPVESVEGATAAVSPRVTVWFNAWKYQTSEQIWAGLAHCIISQVTARMSPASRELFWLKLHASRVDVNKVRWTIRRRAFRELIPLLVSCAVLLIGSVVVALKFVTFGAIGISLSVLTSSLGSWYKWSRKLGEKVSDEFRELVREPDYEGRLGFLHLVESDIRDVLDLVATSKSPLVIFVDDLDRCAPHKVAEVVEAINLFLSGDYPNCIFVLGMEPAVVAAALEVANKDLLDKVRQFGVMDSHVPLGWRFMEKIIQLPLTIPAPGAEGSKFYLAHLTSGEHAAPAAPVTPPVDRVTSYLAEFQRIQTIDQVVNRASELLAEATPLERPAIAEASKRAYAQTFTNRDPAVSRFIENTITLFQGNPRQLKRYVNLFRFISTLRHSVTMDRAIAEGSPRSPMPSDEVVTKFVAMSIHWPQAADYFRLVRESDSSGGSTPRSGALLARLEDGARALDSDADAAAADERWTGYLNRLGLGEVEWARAREFRKFLARGESLAEYESCGLW